MTALPVIIAPRLRRKRETVEAMTVSTFLNGPDQSAADEDIDPNLQVNPIAAAIVEERSKQNAAEVKRRRRANRRAGGASHNGRGALAKLGIRRTIVEPPKSAKIGLKDIDAVIEHENRKSKCDDLCGGSGSSRGGGGGKNSPPDAKGGSRVEASGHVDAATKRPEGRTLTKARTIAGAAQMMRRTSSQILSIVRSGRLSTTQHATGAEI